jgi:hypothetical protein
MLGQITKMAALCCSAEVFFELIFQPMAQLLVIPVKNVQQRDTGDVRNRIPRNGFRPGVKLSACSEASASTAFI